MKFKIKDRVRYISDRYDDSASNPRWGGRYGKIGGTIVENNRGSNPYTILWDNNEKNTTYSDNDLDFLESQFMRRTIEKGMDAKVISRPEVYKDLDDKAKELGATKKWTGKFIPSIGDSGSVLGVDDGYVLVDFGSDEVLLDVSCLDPQKKREEVKFLVKYPNSTLLEEFSTEKEVEKRMQELFKSQGLKPGDLVKVYNVEGYREVKLKIEVAFT